MPIQTTESPIINSSVEKNTTTSNIKVEAINTPSIQIEKSQEDNNSINDNSTNSSSSDNNNNNSNSNNNIETNNNSTSNEKEKQNESISSEESQDNKNDNDQLTNLESNEDYKTVLKALDVLRHQLNRATKDIETLTQLKREAIEDPFTFVEDLKSTKKLKRAPPLQKVISVPEIDWTKYKFIPECRYARQTASLAALTFQYTNVYKKPGMYKNILETDTPPERRTIRPPNSVSKEVKQLQKEIAKAKESIGQVPSRAGSVPASEMSDSEDDQQQQKSMMNGKGKRRVSSQTGTAEKMIPTTIIHSIPSTPIKESSSSSSTSANNGTQTHNQPWTDEEQRRLEELLEIFPDEPVQAQRFAKISQALGTRTPRQVGSRIQKYFIKLAKMGLPVPGRINIPPSASSSSPSSRPGRGRGRGRGKIKNNKVRGPKASSVGYNTLMSGGITNTKISGGYYSTMPTVYMSDDESDDKVKETMLRVANPVLNDDDNNNNINNKVTTDTVIHEGFACDSCGMEPIIGVLYKCTVCDESEEVDLCSKCMALGTFTNDQHTIEHTFEAIQTPTAPYYADNDYASPEHLGEYSYLGF
ncbi:unnamed protein product [Cunninghamella echinulata]